MMITFSRFIHKNIIYHSNLNYDSVLHISCNSCIHGNKAVSTYIDNEKTAINTTRPTFANYSQCC